MEQISELVNEHPFDASLQGIFLKYVKDTQSVEELHASRVLSSQFVDFTDTQWVSWVSDSKQWSVDALVDVLSRIIEQHPSLSALVAAIEALCQVIEAEWNAWTVFAPRPTPVKSCIRFMEQALDKVSTWPDSGVVWSACRAFLISVSSDKETVRKLYLRQLQAVPMPAEARESLISEQKAYEDSVGLSHIAADHTRAAAAWDAWWPFEAQVKEDPSMWLEIMDSRKSVDSSEIVAALFARAVVSNPSDGDLWQHYAAFASESLKNEKLHLSVLERGVKNCPYVGQLWVSLVSAVSPDRLEHVLLLGISALRDSETAEANHEPLSILLLMDANVKLAANDESARECFSSAVSIIAQLSPKLTVSVLLAWLHAEAFHPALAESEQDVTVDLVREFLTSPDWADKRAACAAVDWIQLAWIARKTSDFTENRSESIDFCRSVFTAAISGHPNDTNILHDWKTFEQTFGTVKDVFRVQSLFPKMEAVQDTVTDTTDTVMREERRSKRTRPEFSDRQKFEPRRTEEKKPKLDQVPECVFVKDLAFAVTEDRLAQFFETHCEVGKPKRVLIVMNPDGKSRGFGYAEFESAEIAQKAIEMTGKVLEGRPVHISQSNRQITTKREPPAHVPPKNIEEEQNKSNDYFKSLVMQRQKRR